MPERQIVRLKKPSEIPIPAQQSMDGIKKKRQPRTRWTAAEKQQFIQCREKNFDLSIEEIRDKFYPERSIRALAVMYCRMKQNARNETKTGKESEDTQRLNSSKSPTLKRPRKSGLFDWSDSEEENSDPGDRTGNISPSGRRSPQKFSKTSHSAEPRSPVTRYDRERRGRPQTDETTRVPKEATACSSKPQTTPLETSNVAQDKNYPQPSPSDTGMNAKVPDDCPKQPAKCHGAETQVSVVKNGPQQHSQLQASEEEKSSLESHLINEDQKSVAIILAQIQFITERNKIMASENSEARAQACSLQKEYDSMKREIDRIKTEKEIEMAKLQAERESLKEKNKKLEQENKRLNEIVVTMKSVLNGTKG